MNVTEVRDSDLKKNAFPEILNFTVGILIAFRIGNILCCSQKTFSNSFIGLYTGLALATETEASSWLLALVAGLFTYIPMVDIVSLSVGALRTE